MRERELNKILAYIKYSKYSLVNEPRVYIRCFARLL